MFFFQSRIREDRLVHECENLKNTVTSLGERIKITENNAKIQEEKLKSKIFKLEEVTFKKIKN